MRPVLPFSRHALAAAVLLATGSLLPVAPAAAQDLAATATVDIPAGPLDGVLARFAHQHGLTLSFDPQLLAGRQSTGLSGRHDVRAGLDLLLRGTGIEPVFDDARTVRLQRTAAPLDTPDAARRTQPLRVGAGNGANLALPAYVTAFGGSSIADSGTTRVAGPAFAARLSGNGDANTALRGLANVQYQNDMNQDAGTDGQREIDMRPLELSISGGRLYENNFRLNGVAINNLTGRHDISTGTVSPCGTDPMPDYCGSPDFAMIYGLHSQTVFVPDAFVESTTVIDSNASARYGDFMGGVVDYTLAEPKDERFSGTYSYDHSDSAWTDYRLATENTANRLRPNFHRDRHALSLNIPVREGWAMNLSYSQQDAYTRKQRDAQYINDAAIDDEGTSRYYRLASRHDTAAGRFTVDASYTDYENSVVATSFADSVFDVRTRGLTSQVRHEIDLPGLQWEAAGLGDVSVTSRVFYNHSYAHNGSNHDDVFTPTSSTSALRSGNRVSWASTEYADTCQPVQGVTATLACRYGGFGEREQGQTELGFSSEASGTLLGGRFSAGIGYTKASAERRRMRDSWFYSTYRTVFDVYTSPWAGTGFICAEGDPSCSAEQYAYTGVHHRPFDINVDVDMSNAWLEWDRRFGSLSVRAGLRLDHESYLDNLNLAPRVVLSWTPIESLAFSAGANRYYSGATLFYAIRDAQPSQVAYSRSHSSATGVVGAWVPPRTLRSMSYQASGLDTPYVDELTASVQWNEPWLDGSLRLRWVQREGKDQFATVEETSSIRTLTNDGRNRYRSATLEYLKGWDDLRWADHLGISLSATWSRQSTSANTYFDDDGETSPEDFIWYRDRAWTRATFQEVTGNLDIPLRTALVVDGSWFDNRLTVATSISWNLPYDGVRDSLKDITVDGQRYNIYEDARMSSTAIIGLSGRWQVMRSDTRNLAVQMRIDNLLNDMGNGLVDARSPWKRGRSFWAGLTMGF